ncbi:hypothetical protein VARIO8X_20166 [Burkholderiales bacterium 8X]|nr:hypothetical protein VARIO8X_20166 [Burkholderiales bacterium 8X]
MNCWSAARNHKLLRNAHGRAISDLKML